MKRISADEYFEDYANARLFMPGFSVRQLVIHHKAQARKLGVELDGVEEYLFDVAERQREASMPEYDFENHE